MERRAEFDARVTQNFSICHDLLAVLNRPGRNIKMKRKKTRSRSGAEYNVIPMDTVAGGWG